MAGSNNTNAAPSTRSLIKTFACKNCGGTVTLRASGYSLTASCPSCGSIIDVSDENFALIAKYNNQTKFAEPYIPIGTRGTLEGDKLEVIGFQVREDSSGEKWREYLLFNPKLGFRWLSEYNGHWNYISTIKTAPTLSPDKRKAVLSGKIYYLSYTTTATTRYIFGEFYWRVSVGEKCGLTEYTAPPESLAFEKTDGEIIWSHATYLEPKVIQSAFGIKTSTPQKIGSAPNQGAPFEDSFQNIILLAAGYGALMIFLTVISSAQENIKIGNFVQFILYLIAFPFGMAIIRGRSEALREGGDWGDDSDDD